MTEEIRSLPEGNYDVVIKDFGSTWSSKTRDGLWFLPVLTDTDDGRRLVVYIGASLSGIRMLFAGKSHYVGKKARVRLRHRMHNNVLTYSCDLLWPGD